MINPMSSLPRYGAVIEKEFNLDTQSETKRNGDLIAAVIDYIIGLSWQSFGLFPKQEEKHRKGISILEKQEFLDWAMEHLLKDMEMDYEETLNSDYAIKAEEEFMNSEDEE